MRLLCAADTEFQQRL